MQRSTHLVRKSFEGVPHVLVKKAQQGKNNQPAAYYQLRDGAEEVKERKEQVHSVFQSSEEVLHDRRDIEVFVDLEI